MLQDGAWKRIHPLIPGHFTLKGEAGTRESMNICRNRWRACAVPREETVFRVALENEMGVEG